MAQPRKEIEGKSLFALASREQGKKKEEARLEAHKKYIDIQFILDGVDTMGWRPLSHCASMVAPYDEKNDIVFFADKPLLWCPIHAGMFVIFFPGDAHAPLVSDTEIHKVIVKVAV